MSMNVAEQLFQRDFKISEEYLFFILFIGVFFLSHTTRWCTMYNLGHGFGLTVARYSWDLFRCLPFATQLH